ncbi:MAG TPA: pilus assembly protein PilB, partial [Phycisphaerae bacterium]|nr:pilus assembly protein PilB [Phycisphaerae bacterium]
AIFEIMRMDDELRTLIRSGTSSNVLRSEARRGGMRSLRESGLMNIYDGITTIEEVVRETIVEE